jgi:hypothetical protein
MKQVHWHHQNHFVHYGSAGLNMLASHTMGFRQQFDGGFQFDDVARHQSGSALFGQLATNIYARSDPIQIGDLYSSTCNTSPATLAMYKEALQALVAEGDIVIASQDGRTRRVARYMVDTDLIEPSRQSQLFR